MVNGYAGYITYILWFVLKKQATGLTPQKKTGQEQKKTGQEPVITISGGKYTRQGHQRKKRLRVPWVSRSNWFPLQKANEWRRIFQELV